MPTQVGVIAFGLQHRLMLNDLTGHAAVQLAADLLQDSWIPALLYSSFYPLEFSKAARCFLFLYLIFSFWKRKKNPNTSSSVTSLQRKLGLSMKYNIFWTSTFWFTKIIRPHPQVLSETEISGKISCRKVSLRNQDSQTNYSKSIVTE